MHVRDSTTRALANTEENGLNRNGGRGEVVTKREVQELEATVAEVVRTVWRGRKRSDVAWRTELLCASQVRELSPGVVQQLAIEGLNHRVKATLTDVHRVQEILRTG